LVQALPAFRGECAPAGYACRIAFRAALLARKTAQRTRQRTDDGAVLEHVVAPTERATQMPHVVRSMLDAIPADQAEALSLRTILGWSIEEIAEAAGVPVNTVRSRLRLAKEALRKHIAETPGLAEELGVTAVSA
jgi:RNA polymerase sigma factor (sigma-70 family)